MTAVVEALQPAQPDIEGISQPRAVVVGVMAGDGVQIGVLLDANAPVSVMTDPLLKVVNSRLRELDEVPLEEMLEATKSWQESGFNVFSGGDLRRMGISAATVAALGQALSDPAAEVAVYARQYRDDAKGPSASVLSLKDGSGGRIALYQQVRTAGSGEAWLAICPATPQLVQVGIKTVLDTLPYGEWKTHRRV